MMDTAPCFQGFTELILCFNHTPFTSDLLLEVKGKTSGECALLGKEEGKGAALLYQITSQMPGMLTSTHWLLFKREKYRSNHF